MIHHIRLVLVSYIDTNAQVPQGMYDRGRVTRLALRESDD